MRFPIIIGAILVFFLAACGGGGGGGSSPGTGPAGPPSFGTAALPGATISVTKTAGNISPGSGLTVRVATADPGISSVMVLVGADWEHATAADSILPGVGVWDARFTLPNPLPTAAGILVRITFNDGNVVESSRDAFPL